MSDLILDDIGSKLFIMNQITVDRIFSSDNPADNFALYGFYYKTAKWQNSNLAKATDVYVMECLGWGKDRLRRAKESLKEMGLIQIVQMRDENRISGWFVKVNYISSNQKNLEVLSEQTVENYSDNQQVLFPTGVKKTTNIIDNKNNNNLNILNIPKEKSKKEKVKEFSEIDNYEDLFVYWEANKKGSKYKSKFRNMMLEKLKKLSNNDFAYAKEAIEYCVANNYQGFFNGNGLYFSKKGKKNSKEDILARLNRGEVVMYEEGMEVPLECTVYDGQILKW